MFAGLGRIYFLVAVLVALCLAGGPVGVWLLASLTSGWRRALGALGSTIVGVGILLWCTAFGLLFADPSTAFTQRLTPAGSLAMSVGMVLLGSAVVASQRLAGWRRFVPLVVGLYFPLQLVRQLLFFLNGRDSAPGPNGLLLGGWGVCWVLLGYAILSCGLGGDRLRHGCAPSDVALRLDCSRVFQYTMHVDHRYASSPLSARKTPDCAGKGASASVAEPRSPPQ